MAALAAYVDKQVLVLTQDGRTIVGELKGFDQTTNVILSHSYERVFSSDEGVEQVELGLYIGMRIADLGEIVIQTLVGEVDEQEEKQIDWSTVRAEPISEILH